MTKTEIVACIQQKIGHRTDLEARIDNSLLMAQTILEENPDQPWFLETILAGTSVDGTRIALPANFSTFSPNVDTTTWIRTSTGVYRPTPLADYAALVGSELDATKTVDGIKAAARVGLDLYVFPKASEAFDYQILYFKKDSALSTTNLWSVHAASCLLNLAGAITAKGTRDQVALDLFNAEFQLAWTALLAKNTSMRETGVGRIVESH